MNRFKTIYQDLLKKHGKQGWWPIINSKTLICEYHAGDPKNDAERFEICIGAILTQNTSWTQAGKALINLKRMNALNVKRMRRISDGKLKEVIKCAGYYNQKTKKIKIFTEFFSKLRGQIPTRKDLLNIWGIGKETADSILLYGYNVPVFIIDAYTKRLLLKEGLIDEKAGYDDLQQLFHRNLEKNVKLFKEYHALIVAEGKIK